MKLEPEDLQLLRRLKEDNTEKGARPVIESQGWEQALKLSRAGLIAIEQLAMGGRLHITLLGNQAVDQGLLEDYQEELERGKPVPTWMKVTAAGLLLLLPVMWILEQRARLSREAATYSCGFMDGIRSPTRLATPSEISFCVDRRLNAIAHGLAAAKDQAWQLPGKPE